MKNIIFLILIQFGCNNPQGIKKTIESSYLLVKNGDEYVRQEMRMNTKTIKYFNQNGINYKQEYVVDDQLIGSSEFKRNKNGKIIRYKSYNANGQLTRFSEVKDNIQYFYDQDNNLISYTKTTESVNKVESLDYDSSDRLVSISINEFDSLENPISTTMIHFRNEKSDTLRFQIDYEQFDDFGNWTKRVSRNGSEGTQLKVDERQIEYY